MLNNKYGRCVFNCLSVNDAVLNFSTRWHNELSRIDQIFPDWNVTECGAAVSHLSPAMKTRH